MSIFYFLMPDDESRSIVKAILVFDEELI